MAQDYSPQITRVGLAKLTNASLLGKQLTLSHMAVGDGSNSTVNLDATQLEHEVYRAPINEIRLDDNAADRVLAVLVIPIDVGGFNITELGLFDSDGELIAVSRFPATYKPTLDEGTGREISVRMKLQLSNVNVIKLQVDPTAVLATKQELSDHNADPDAHPEMRQHIEDTNDPHSTIPDGGKTGQVLIKQADGGIAWGTIAGVPVGELCFSTNGVALPGTIPVNVKQKVLCSAFPQLFEWMKGGTYLTDEAAWDAEATAQDGTCGKYCWDGGDYFVLPCYQHHFAAATVNNPAGSWLPDELKAHSHVMFTGNYITIDAYGGEAHDYDLRSDGEVRTQSTGGTETRPKTSYILPCIKAFDVPINVAHVDMLGLAQQVADINGNKADKSSFKNLLASNGYQSLEGGAILQWGEVTRSANNTPVLFPDSFPNNVLQCFVNNVESVSGYADISLKNLTKNGFTVIFDAGSDVTRACWWAIGH